MGIEGIIWGFIGFAIGGVLKGATGAGAPIVAVPLLAMFYNVPMAIAIFTFPNLISNAWQGWQFRANLLPTRFVLSLCIAGGIGAGLGSLLLANLPASFLQIGVALTALAYIGFKLLRPDWVLDHGIAKKLAAPVGLVAGVLQGAAGVSAPVSLTFLNAMKLERPQFIATISVFFGAMAVVQIPLLAWLGILTLERTGLSLLAMIPLFAGMPVGRWLAKFMSREMFDKVILILLAAIAFRLIAGVVL